MSQRPALRTSPVAPKNGNAPAGSPEEYIAKGRMLAEKNVPSFIPALRASTFLLDAKLPTIAAVDKYWRTYWNPRGVEWLVRAAQAVDTKHPCPTCGVTSHNKYAYVAGVWIHEVGHCVFRHHLRQEEGPYSSKRKWNIATDLEMNDDIPGIGKDAEEAAPRNDDRCPRMCLPSKVAVNVNEYLMWYALGMEEFKALTNKDLFDVFHPPGAGTESMTQIPFLMFPEAVPAGTGNPLEFVSFDRGKIAENYYEMIVDPPQEDGEGESGEGSEGEGEGSEGEGEGSEGNGKSGKGKGGKGSKGLDELNDHGSGSGGEQRAWEYGKPGEDQNPHGISEAESTAIRRDVATKIKQPSNGRGTLPAGWQVWADTQLQPPKVRWQDKLRAVARLAINRVRGERYTTFRRPSRSSINQDCKIIRPSTYDVTPTVVIVVDTSGSMGAGARSRLERALSECEAILKIGKLKSYFLDCDANVYGKAQEVRSLRSAKVHGGGGTDMRIGVLAAQKNKPAPDIIVLLTDGETPWPSASEVRNVKIITAICNERDMLSHIPPYMNPIWVED